MLKTRALVAQVVLNGCDISSLQIKLAPCNVRLANDGKMSTTYTLKRGSFSAVLREDDVTVDNLARIFKVCSR